MVPYGRGLKFLPYKHAIAAYDAAKTGIPSQIGELIAPNS